MRQNFWKLKIFIMVTLTLGSRPPVLLEYSIEDNEMIKPDYVPLTNGLRGVTLVFYFYIYICLN